MQPDNLLETDFTRAARESIDRAKAGIEQRLASIDQSTREGQYIAAASRFQQQVLAALLLWMAGEDERGTAFPVLMNAVENGMANMLASILSSKLEPAVHRRAAEQLMHGIARDLFRDIATLETAPDHPDCIQGRAVPATGRA